MGDEVKLADGNYYHWEYNMRMKLMRKGLLAHIVRPESDKTYDRTLVQWFENDLKALGVIAGGVAHTHQVYIRDAQTALAAWTQLEQHYNRDSMKNQIKINKKLHSFKMEAGARMTHHIDSFKELVFQLQSIGSVMAEPQQVVLLLGSLTPEYNMIVSILENTPSVTLSHVMETLVNSEVEQTHDRVELAFQGQRGKVASATRPFTGKCHFCGKTGHKKSDCWKLRDGRTSHGAARATRNSFAFTAASTTTQATRNYNWLVDSGASAHMCCDALQFVDLVKLEHPLEIRIADGKTISGTGQGSVRLQLNNGKTVMLSNVLYIPKLDRNLLSVPALTKRGVNVRFMRDACVFTHQGARVFVGEKRGEGYYVNVSKANHNAHAAQTMSTWEEVHAKVGHIPSSSYKRLAAAVDGVPDLPPSELASADLCDGCCMGKMHAAPFPRRPASKVKSSRPLELVHADLFGPVHVQTPGGCRYGAVFVDDFTRMIWIYFLKKKSELAAMFKDFKASVEKESGLTIVRLRSDNGGEYTSSELSAVLKGAGIRHETSVPHTPQQNGLAERTNRTILETARCLLYHKSVNLKWWAEAANTSVYLLNRTPNSINDRTPYEMWTGKRPNLHDAQIFGEVGYAHDPRDKKKKLEPRSYKCVFLGYAATTKGYRVLNLETKKVQIARTIKMSTVNRQLRLPDDLADYGSDDDDEVAVSGVPSPSVDVPMSTASVESDNKQPVKSCRFEQNPTEMPDVIVFSGKPKVSRKSDSVGSMKPAMKIARSPDNLTVKDWTRIEQSKYHRQNHDTEVRDARHHDANHIDYEIALSARVVPSSFQEAVNSDESDQWEKAMRDELQSLSDNHTWDVTQLPPHRNAVGCKWVFTKKTNELGQVVRYKARLVAQGFSQRYGEDYIDTYSPVASTASIRVFLVDACANAMHIEQCDVDTAFLYGELDEEIYMRMPQGLERLGCKQASPTQGDDDDNASGTLATMGAGATVCRLRKSLYGLKQASRVWNQTIDGALRAIDLKPTTADPCVYVSTNAERQCMLCLYVDDLLIASASQQTIDDVKAHLKSVFRIKELGPVKFVLGIEVIYQREQRVLQLIQRAYIDQVVEKFNQQHAKPTELLADPGIDLDSASEVDVATRAEMSRRPYRSIIGCLMYLSSCTRPDVSVVVLKLSQHLERPEPKHWIAAIRVVRYLNTTRNVGLKYDGAVSSELVAYSDADWGSSKGNRRSISGSILMMCGGPVAWKATVQRSVALSSTEAEYMALSACVKECIWARRLIGDLTGEPVGATSVYEDNQGAIALAHNNGYHARTKHVDIRYHFIRELVESNTVELTYVKTDDQLADFLTKLLPAKRLQVLLAKAGIVAIGA